MAKQLGFELPSVPHLGRDDFLVTPLNAVALTMVEAWQDWPARKLLLFGPSGAGKTHLAHIWAQSASVSLIAATDLSRKEVPVLAGASVAVEDIDKIAGDTEAETALFHLHNLLLAEGGWLLLTGCGAPKHWPFALPDLKSRVEGTQAVGLEPPDDALLAAVLAKLFADRQLNPKTDVIPYLVARMDRTFDMAQRLVAQLDATSLAEKRPISRQLARHVLDNLEPRKR